MKEQGGFSLVEMLIVLGIVAIVTVMLMSRLGVGLATARGDLAARIVANEVRELRMLAIRGNRVEELSVASGGRAILTTRRPRITLPGDAVASIDRPAIRFLPDGRSSGGRLVLRGGASAIVIDVDWLTGSPRTMEQAP